MINLPASSVHTSSPHRQTYTKQNQNCNLFHSPARVCKRMVKTKLKNNGTATYQLVRKYKGAIDSLFTTTKRLEMVAPCRTRRSTSWGFLARFKTFSRQIISHRLRAGLRLRACQLSTDVDAGVQSSYVKQAEFHPFLERRNKWMNQLSIPILP